MAVAASKGATVTGVHGHLVLRAGIDALDDVDFTAAWPCRSYQ